MGVKFGSCIHPSVLPRTVFTRDSSAISNAIHSVCYFIIVCFSACRFFMFYVCFVSIFGIAIFSVNTRPELVRVCVCQCQSKLSLLGTDTMRFISMCVFVSSLSIFVLSFEQMIMWSDQAPYYHIKWIAAHTHTQTHKYTSSSTIHSQLHTFQFSMLVAHLSLLGLFLFSFRSVWFFSSYRFVVGCPKEPTRTMCLCNRT